MRVSLQTPGMGGGADPSVGFNEKPLLGQPTGGNLVPRNGGGVQFGTAEDLKALHSKVDSGSDTESLIKQLIGLLKGMQPAAGTQPDAGVTQPQGAGATAGPQPQAPVANEQPVPKGADPAFLDNSEYSSPEELKKYDAVVAHLPPEQREQAAKELNRPLAAAKMAAKGGEGAEEAKAFFEANPTLKTALDTARHGGKPDGDISKNDYKSFIKNMEKAAGAASKDVEEYQKQNPNADAQSLAMVGSAAVLRANEPLAKAGALNEDGNVDKYITGDALNNLQNSDPGLSSALKQSAITFSEPGFLKMLDQGGFEGQDLALHNPDQKISTKNIDQWIKKQAPTSGGEFASMMSDAATRNAVAQVDISHLDEDVFKNPNKYSGAEKAAVMVKLQETQEQVDGGSKLRKVDKTSEALSQKIAQLQQDPDVKSWMNAEVPKQSQAMIAKDPNLSAAVSQRLDDVKSGKALEKEMKAAEDEAAKANEGKKPEDQTPVDYSKALGNMDAELQLQGDVNKDKGVPTSSTAVLDGRPDLKAKIDASYQASFVQGKAVESALKNDQKSDPVDVLGQTDAKKAAYDSALGEKATAAYQASYANATMTALTATKKGVEVLTDLKKAGTLPKDADVTKMSGNQMYGQLKDNVEKQTSLTEGGKFSKVTTVGGSAMGVASLLSVQRMLDKGDEAGAAKAIYDSARGTAELGKLGYNAAAQALGKDASAGLGRMAGAVAGRVVGMVAGQATGMAAAAAIGAAAGPIGWAIDAALAIGFGIKAIVDAVKKHERQETFDHNVDPTLEQFGIPKAH
jgi:hypothetical protein